MLRPGIFQAELRGVVVVGEDFGLANKYAYIFSFAMAESILEMAFLPLSPRLIEPPGIRADDAYVWPGRVA